MFLCFYFQGLAINLPQTIETERMVSMVHLETSLVADMIRPDLPMIVAFADAVRGRIRSVNSVETTTKIGLEVVAAVVGNLSNFDSLEFQEKRKPLLLLLTP